MGPDERPACPQSFLQFCSFRTLPLSPRERARGEGNVVLKIGVPRDELTSEIAALCLFNGGVPVS